MKQGLLLQIGSKFLMRNSNTIGEVVQLLGEGGQGEVYRAQVGKSEYALKWYFPQSATTEQWKTIDDLVKDGAPSQKFLWPRDLCTSSNSPTFGYLMDLLPSGYSDLESILFGMNHPNRISTTFKTLILTSLNMVKSFIELHAKGMCYRDVNAKNILFNPKSGDVLICDCDNVSIDDGVLKGVLGTLCFMAPEIVRGDAVPSTRTDKASLATLLFHVFYRHHPFHGKVEFNMPCLGVEEMRSLYSGTTPYIFHPTDHTNALVRGEQDLPVKFRKKYPEFFNNAFTKAFVDGLNNPSSRVQENEWRRILARLYDLLDRCPNPACAAEQFYTGPGALGGVCPKCQTDRAPALVLEIGSHKILMSPGNGVYGHHLVGPGVSPSYDKEALRGYVDANPKNPASLGLRNKTDRVWMATRDNKTMPVDPDRVVPILPGLSVNFGTVVGTFVPAAKV